jgi:hypothetical protein
VKHGGGGDIVQGRFADAEGEGIELIALDRGPGMADLERCLGDGYSSAGTPGGGLGAIRRLADRFAIFSRPGLGTAVLARLVLREAAGRRVTLGAVGAPYPGESVSGDGWAAATEGDPTLLLVDGSGHGAPAARAVEIATHIFAEQHAADCERIAVSLHRALAPTRGAALALARIDGAAGMLRFVGIGNIVGALAGDDGVRRMVSHNGTAGHVAPRIREFTYKLSGTPLVILHSDGVSARWEMAQYPGLALAHPALVAGVLFRDFRRGRDDATVVAMRPL